MTEPPHEHDNASLLGLPDTARQDHRITKKMLAGQFEERAPADARLIAKAVAAARLVGSFARRRSRCRGIKTASASSSTSRS